MKRLRTLTRKDIATATPQTPLRKANTRELVGIALCFLSFLLFTLCFVYVRKVFIDIKIPILVGILAGVAGVFFTKKRENYVYVFLAFGSLVVIIPLMINYIFANDQTETVKLAIIKKHLYAGRRGSSVDVAYKGIVKEITVESYAELKNSSFIQLKISSGALGYDVIKDSKLLKE